MSFVQAIQSALSKYADFKGRARRSEYWFFVLFVNLVSAVLGVLGQWIGLFSVLAGLFSLAMFVPSLALVWRRLHDIGKSGASFLLFLIPLVGWILLVVWFCRDGEPGTNGYGFNPKEVNP